MALAFLDTSVWLHGGQAPANVGRRTLAVTTLVLAEVASLVERGRAPAHLVAEILATARVEDVTLEDAVSGGKLHGRLRRGGSKASLIDCVTHATARRVKAVLLTRDRDLAGQPGVVLVG